MRPALQPATSSTHGLVGQSSQIRETRRLIEKAARHQLPVLLLGESGTGKEVVARAIHAANPRGQFVPIDCGSLVGTLLFETEGAKPAMTNARAGGNHSSAFFRS